MSIGEVLVVSAARGHCLASLTTDWSCCKASSGPLPVAEDELGGHNTWVGQGIGQCQRNVKSGN